MHYLEEELDETSKKSSETMEETIFDTDKYTVGQQLLGTSC